MYMHQNLSFKHFSLKNNAIKIACQRFLSFTFGAEIKYFHFDTLD